VTGLSPKVDGGRGSAEEVPGGLLELLRTDPEAVSGFAGELHGLLAQLSPAQLRQLEQLLEGGMRLPQAASQVLGGRLPHNGIGDASSLLADAAAALADDQVPASRQAGNPLGTPLDLLRALAPAGGRGDVPDFGALPAAGASAAATTAAPLPGGGLPQGLTGSLMQMVVPQPVGGRGWDGAIADRVSWMVQGDMQFARLKLNPPHLGPLEVRLTLNQDQTTVAFIAQHAAVREAIEAALPRLREMFDQQSLQLVQADVSDPGAQQRNGSGSQTGSDAQAIAGGDAMSPEDAALSTAAGATAASGRGMVDLFV
jgi:flagellar hook-length control protein FliK